VCAYRRCALGLGGADLRMVVNPARHSPSPIHPLREFLTSCPPTASMTGFPASELGWRVASRRGNSIFSVVTANVECRVWAFELRRQLIQLHFRLRAAQRGSATAPEPELQPAMDRTRPTTTMSLRKGLPLGRGDTNSWSEQVFNADDQSEGQCRSRAQPKPQEPWIGSDETSHIFHDPPSEGACSGSLPIMANPSRCANG
jgi:hypothetical protein